ncbi:MAG: outer membrane protein assembly factor BamE [Cellvibrionaceae bacterium]
MRKKSVYRLMSVMLLSAIVAGCSILPNAYRIDIPQGNLLDQDKVAELKIGMEPRQVRYLLGTPLITDTFNQNRWDYFYSLESADKITVDHHLSIFFANGRVIDIKDQLKDKATN